MEIIFQILILIFSVVIHEVSHGYAALMLGDRTAQHAGRLTLNPIVHVDIFGSVILPVMLVITNSPILFAWAKPVPYNPYNLRDQKWGPAMVGIAGPAANFSLAIAFGLLIRFLVASAPAGPLMENFLTIAGFIVFINLVLGFFNLVPIPPLDGSKVLFAVLPWQWMQVRMFLERYGFFVLIFFVFFFSHLVVYPVFFVFRLITGVLPF
jgi:Zn-dependent protease